MGRATCLARRAAYPSGDVGVAGGDNVTVGGPVCPLTAKGKTA
jgi:hypothetical protein